MEKGIKSFPKYIGKRLSNSIAAIFYILAIVLSFIPFFRAEYDIFFQNYAYFYPVFLCDVMLLSTALHLIFKKKPHMKLYRKISLIAIFIGLLSFLIGSLIRF